MNCILKMNTSGKYRYSSKVHTSMPFMIYSMMWYFNYKPVDVLQTLTKPQASACINNLKAVTRIL
jgi:hypothetical protein